MSKKSNKHRENKESVQIWITSEEKQKFKSICSNHNKNQSDMFRFWIDKEFGSIKC